MHYSFHNETRPKTNSDHGNYQCNFVYSISRFKIAFICVVYQLDFLINYNVFVYFVDIRPYMSGHTSQIRWTKC